MAKKTPDLAKPKRGGAPKGHKPFNENGEGGRPPKYSNADIEEYANKFKTWLSDPDHVWFKDFALHHDLDPDLLSEWAAANERFHGVYKLAKNIQESRILTGGLTNAYNGNIVKFILSNKHGWVEKQETKLSGDSQNPLNFLLQTADGLSKDLVDDEA